MEIVTKYLIAIIIIAVVLILVFAFLTDFGGRALEFVRSLADVSG